jgi:hypothetical protein
MADTFHENEFAFRVFFPVDAVPATPTQSSRQKISPLK